MIKRERELLEVVNGVSAQFNASVDGYEMTGSGHYRVRITRSDGRAISFIAPFSTSDKVRLKHNLTSQLRRMLA